MRRGPAAAVAGGILAVAAVGAAIYLEARGPRPASEAPPGVRLLVFKAGASTPVPAGATLARADALEVKVSLDAAARVSLVHLDLGHGMEPLVLNVPMGPGEHTFDADSGALRLRLEDLSGPQVLAAVASERELIADEALTAARGVPVRGCSMARETFSVQP